VYVINGHNITFDMKKSILNAIYRFLKLFAWSPRFFWEGFYYTKIRIDIIDRGKKSSDHTELSNMKRSR